MFSGSAIPFSVTLGLLTLLSAMLYNVELGLFIILPALELIEV